MANVRTGTAGWVYEPWRGTFFPPGLVQKKELAFASSHLSTIEINATFRATQKPDSFRKWAGETPADFLFSIKGPQLVTHVRKLRNCRKELANFFASGPLALGEKLGPFVWQLPPTLTCDLAVLNDFLDLLPRTPEAYLALASQADERLKTPPFIDLSGITVFRHAIEFRHASFNQVEVQQALAAHNVSWVIADTVEYPDRPVTADFVYCRLQGPARPDATGYTADDIAAWVETIQSWVGKGLDVLTYFVHEDKVHAPANAISLRQALGTQRPGD